MEVIQCYLRNGCPVMDRDGALEILKGMERLDSGGVDLQAEELRWWKETLPFSARPGPEEVSWPRRRMGS
jgi:hypothetical protein